MKRINNTVPKRKGLLNHKQQQLNVAAPDRTKLHETDAFAALNRTNARWQPFLGNGSWERGAEQECGGEREAPGELGDLADSQACRPPPFASNKQQLCCACVSRHQVVEESGGCLNTRQRTKRQSTRHTDTQVSKSAQPPHTQQTATQHPVTPTVFCLRTGQIRG